MGLTWLTEGCASQQPILTVVSTWICSKTHPGWSQTRCWPLLVGSKVSSPELKEGEEEKKWWFTYLRFILSCYKIKCCHSKKKKKKKKKKLQKKKKKKKKKKKS